MTRKEARIIALRQATALLYNYEVKNAFQADGVDSIPDAIKVTEEVFEIGRQILIKAERFGGFNHLTGNQD